VRFREGGGLCYNRWAVRDAAKLQMSPGDVRGAGVARSQATGASLEPAETGMPFATEGAAQGKPFGTQGRPFEAQGRHEDASRYCPVCSQRLESRRCKLVCDTCGYYMSCADYY